MNSSDALTPVTVLALCHEYMSYARSVQDFDSHDQKFFKNTLIFAMILSFILLHLAADNPTNEGDIGCCKHFAQASH